MEIHSAFMTAERVGYWVPRQGFGGKYFIANLVMKKTIASENKLDNWFLSNTSIRKTKTWIPVIDGEEGKPKAVTLQRYIRNFIHHPENTKNLKYTPAELKHSIEEMLSCLAY